MNAWRESHRKHPARPFVITLTGMIAVFGSFLLLLFLCGNGGSSFGHGTDKGAGNAGQKQQHGTRAGSGGALKSEHPGPRTAAVSVSSGAAGRHPDGIRIPARGTAKAEEPVRKSRKLIPYQIPVPVPSTASGSGGAGPGLPACGTGSSDRSAASPGDGTFYGIRNCGSMLYIVDISSSMSSPTAEGPSRMEILRKQLVSAVRGEYRRTSPAKYSVIAFSSGIRIFPENQQLARCSLSGDMKRLEDFTQDLACSGGTCMMTAWQEACSLLKKNRVDTICFLTDGEPTDCNMRELIRYIQQNVPAGIRIHTIVIGDDKQELRTLAKQYHGQYRNIR